jgi:hypothetical protein
MGAPHSIAIHPSLVGGGKKGVRPPPRNVTKRAYPAGRDKHIPRMAYLSLAHHGYPYARWRIAKRSTPVPPRWHGSPLILPAGAVLLCQGLLLGRSVIRRPL